MTKHTPGPWYVQHDREKRKLQIRYSKAYGATIANVTAAASTMEQDIANAHLIAAAPELLDALQELLEADIACDGEGLALIKYSDTESGEAAVKKARAAIAKATGVE